MTTTAFPIGETEYERAQRLLQEQAAIQPAPVRLEPVEPERHLLAVDHPRFFYTLLALTGVFALTAFAASYSGQYSMAQHTYLPTWLWWLVPLFIEFPLVIAAGQVAFFRHHRRSVVLPWLIAGALTAVSSGVNIIHVLSEAGVLAGGALGTETITGATIMGIAPVLVLLGWEEIVRMTLTITRSPK